MGGPAKTELGRRSENSTATEPPLGISQHRLAKTIGVLHIQLDYDIEVELDRHTAELDAITSLTA